MAQESYRTTINVAGEEWTLEDPGVAIDFVDMYAEQTVSNGVLYMSFAQVIFEGDNKKRAIVKRRLRIPLAVAMSMTEIILRLNAMAQEKAKPKPSSSERPPRQRPGH